jgi:putative dimethyl sulfoxide reductase chaperone
VGLTLQLVAATYRSPEAPLQADLASGALQEALDALAAHAGVDAPDRRRPRLGPRAVEPRRPVRQQPSGGIVAPPYVGFAIDGELLGPSAEALRALPRTTASRSTPTGRPARPRRGGRRGRLLAARGAGREAAARDLLARFLSPWFQRYAGAIAAADVSGFYGPLTEFLGSVMSEVAREAAA